MSGSIRRRTLVPVVAAVLFASVALEPTARSDQSLTEEELTAIEELAKSMPVRDAIGQLLVVGPPGDAKNYLSREDLSSFIRDDGVGNLLMSSYHYPLRGTDSPQSTVQHIQLFHTALREKYRTAAMPPPLLFVDYEGEGGANSFRNQSLDKRDALSSPPSALTLASTGDKDLIRLAGKLAGYQLRYLGVDAVLGPVIDLDGTNQGQSTDLIGTRVFGATPSIVHGASSHYLFGLQDTGILVFPKHYPGYGYVRGRAHGGGRLPTFYGSAENFRTNLATFHSLGRHSSGLVSAHFMLANLAPGALSTFHPTVMRDLLRRSDDVELDGEFVRGLGLEDVVLVSDDLTDMNAIHQYRDETKTSHVDVAHRAFLAGHDLLLLSHLETESTRRGSRRNDFDLEALDTMVEKLTSLAEKDLSFEQQIRESLLRVLLLKAKLLKAWSPGRPADLTAWNLPPPIEGDLSRPLVLEGTGYTSSVEVVAEIMRKSYVSMLPQESSAAPFLDDTENVKVFIPESVRPVFDDLASLPNVTIDIVPEGWGDEGLSFEDVKAEISAATERYRWVVYIYRGTIDDRNLVLHMANTLSSAERKSVILLIHTTPKALPTEALDGFRLFGNFSDHPLAYQADKDFLRRRIRAQDYTNVPVEVGADGEISKPSKYLPPAEGLSFVPDLYSSPSETRLRDENTDLRTTIEELKAEVERHRARESSLWKLLRLLVRSAGLLVALAGVGLLVVGIRRAMERRPTTTGEKWWAALIDLGLGVIGGGLKQAGLVFAALALVVVGSMMLFDLGVGRLYGVVAGRVDGYLEASSARTAEGSQEPPATGGNVAEGG